MTSPCRPTATPVRRSGSPSTAPGDPLTLGGAAALLFGIGALCACLTGRGATRINLHEALQGGAQ
jgi:hypothetical protein